MVGEEQLTWVANDLAHVPPDKLIMIATHIPLVSFIGQESTKHQTDDVAELYALLDGRPALSVSGHTQMVENLVAGDSYAGWQEAVGVNAVPSTTWWSVPRRDRGGPATSAPTGSPRRSSAAGRRPAT